MDDESGAPVRSLNPVLVAELVSAPSVDQLLGRFLDDLLRRSASFAAGVYVHDSTTGRPATSEVRGLGSFYVHRYERYGRDRDPVVQHALQHRQVCDSDSLMSRTEWLDLPVVQQVFLPHGMARVLCAPLVIGDEVAGTVNLARHVDQPPFEQEDRRNAAVAATVCGIAVSAVRERAALDRRCTQLIAALDRCATAVVVTDLALARRHLNAPAAALLDRLGPRCPDLEPLLDCDDAGRVASMELTAAGAPIRVTVSSQRVPGQPDVIVSVLEERGRPRAALSPTHLLVLTPREAEVAACVLAGRRDPEIAAELFLSLHTVKHHLKSIRAKLGVHTRAELIHRLLH